MSHCRISVVFNVRLVQQSRHIKNGHTQEDSSGVTPSTHDTFSDELHLHAGLK